jgi:sensor histidine kinase YesM
MKSAVYLNDKKARLFGIPLISLAMKILTQFQDFLLLSENFWRGWTISFIITLLIWEGCRLIFTKLHQWFPAYHQTTIRIIYLIGLCVIYAFIVSNIVDFGVCRIIFQNKLPKPFPFYGFFLSLMPTILCMMIYESVYFFQAWKENVQKTESLARENIQSQLDALKNQLDPHFLFNSLNTLASLIDDNNTDAQKYLEQLSDVYRYVLENREKNTVSLEEEIEFLDAYIYLNKTRYRENLLVEKEIPEQMYQQQIAPLSLQMLVENAIKHNVVSREKPLTIRILPEQNNYLTVENNIQEKKTFEKSTKVGLQNIINRYDLLTDRKVEILKNELSFKVKIPLLKS